MALGSDPSAIAGARVQKGLVKRVWRFARSYRLMLVGFLATIVLAALIDLVPPLLIRQIIDVALPDEDRGAVALLAGLMVAVAVAEAVLSLVERLWSSKIGEGLIYDLRVGAVRPRAAHADRLLHPHPDRRAGQPAQQRRDRRPAGGHRHARLGRLATSSSLATTLVRHALSSSGGSRSSRWCCCPCS